MFIDPYSSGSLHWHWGNHMIAPLPVKKLWRIWMKLTSTKPNQIMYHVCNSWGMLSGVTWWPTQHALHDLPSMHCMSDAVVMVQVINKGVWPSAWHMIRFNKFTPGVTMNKLLTMIHLVIVRQKPCQTMLHAKVIDQQETWIPYLLYKNTYCMWLDGALFNRNVHRMEMLLMKFNYFGSEEMIKTKQI